jgi:hypothetical protein
LTCFAAAANKRSTGRRQNEEAGLPDPDMEQPGNRGEASTAAGLAVSSTSSTFVDHPDPATKQGAMGRTKATDEGANGDDDGGRAGVVLYRVVASWTSSCRRGSSCGCRDLTHTRRRQTSRFRLFLFRRTACHDAGAFGPRSLPAVAKSQVYPASTLATTTARAGCNGPCPRRTPPLGCPPSPCAPSRRCCADSGVGLCDAGHET